MQPSGKGGKESLYDQDGCHGHIWLKPSKFFLWVVCLETWYVVSYMPLGTISPDASHLLACLNESAGRATVVT